MTSIRKRHVAAVVLEVETQITVNYVLGN